MKHPTSLTQRVSNRIVNDGKIRIPIEQKRSQVTTGCLGNLIESTKANPTIVDADAQLRIGL